MQATRHLVAENECFRLQQEGSADEDTRKLATLLGELEIIDEVESKLDANN